MLIKKNISSDYASKEIRNIKKQDGTENTTAKHILNNAINEMATTKWMKTKISSVTQTNGDRCSVFEVL